jgi:hypothetical protein
LGGIKAGLAGGVTAAQQQVGREQKVLAGVGAADRLRQHGRLVEAPPHQPQPVQRHRRNQIGVGDQLGAGARQPSPEGWCAMGAVAMFEADHQTAAQIVIVQHRPRPVEQGLGANAGPAHRISAGVERVGHAANRALRRGYEFGVDPAFRTQAARCRDQGIAGEALGRQHGIDQPAHRAGRNMTHRARRR